MSASVSPGRLNKQRFMGSCPEVLTHYIWGTAPKFVFGQYFPLMLMLLVWGPYFKNHWYTGYYVIIKKEKLGARMRRLGKDSWRKGHKIVIKDAKKLARRRILQPWGKEGWYEKLVFKGNHNQPDVAGAESLMQTVVEKTKRAGTVQRAQGPYIPR